MKKILTANLAQNKLALITWMSFAKAVVPIMIVAMILVATRYSLSIYQINSSKQMKRSITLLTVAVELLDRQGNLVPITALLDTGTRSTIVLKPFIKKGAASSNATGQQEWTTLGGKFYTSTK